VSDQTHLCGAFVERVRSHPDTPFAVLVSRGDEHTLTNGWVLERGLAIGRILHESGLMPGDLVMIVLEHCADLYPSFLGCMIRGFVPAFMPPLTVKQDPEIFRRSMAALFSRTAPAAVITSLGSRDHVPGGSYRRLHIEEIDVTVCHHACDVATRLLHDLPDSAYATAFLQHSSGTTGLKKGVMLSHHAVLEQIRLYANTVGVVTGDVVTSWLPLYHDMGLITSFLLPTVIGNLIVSLDALEWSARPTMLLDYMERYRAGYVWLPNFAYHHLLRAAKGPRRWDLTGVKAIINCSEPCRADTFEKFAERFAEMGIDQTKLQVCYAMAENVFAVSQTTFGVGARHGQTAATRPFLSCGRPVPGVELKIRDADDSPVESGGLGEICIRSTTLFQGYFRQEDVTAERLRDGWFHTNDLGCIEAGELFVLGRVDDLLIINGKNLFAHELEDLLTSLAGMTPGRVLACTDFDPRMGANRLLILGEPEREDTDIKALEVEIRRVVLAQTGIFPGAVHFLPRGFLVKSTSGKIARAETIRKYKERMQIG
jgi:acyl-CoA synthetase (AMP-forming)/AMP-acid ligase II